MDILGLIEILLQMQRLRAAAQAAERRLGGLLHDGAQIAGQLQLTAAVHHVDLDLEDLTAHLCPGKAIDHADLVAGDMYRGRITNRSQIIRQVFLCNVDTLYIVGHQLHSSLAAQLTDLSLQNTDAGFPCVVGDGAADSAVGHMELRPLQSMLLQLLGQQMLLGDLKLFLVGIAGQLNDLHTIQQRPRDSPQHVGGGDEHDAAQVNRDLQKMIPESVVLLAVKYLQQRRGGVAPHIAGQLIDLVQHQQRVHGTGAGHGIDDAAGHGADIGLAMAADIRFVPHAAQTESGQLAVHSLGYGDGDRGFAYAGRANQTQNLALGVGVDLLYSDELQNTLLDLIKAKVLLVQNRPCLRHIGPVFGGLVPRHIQTNIQIIADHRCLGAAVGLLGKAIHFLHQLLVDLLRKLQLFDPVRILGDLLVAVVAQLVLQHLQLLPQDHVLLHLCYAGAHLVLHLHLKGDDLHLMSQDLIQQPQTLDGVQLLQNALAVTVAQIDILCDEIGQVAGITAVQHGGDKVIVEVGDQLLILTKDHIGLSDQRLHAGRHAAGKILLQQLHIGLQKWLILPQAVNAGALTALDDHSDAGLRGLEDLQNTADGAYAVKIVLRRRGGRDLTLGHQKDGAFIALHGAVQRIDGDLALHIKAQRQIRENCQTPQGNDRDIQSRSFHKRFSFAGESFFRCRKKAQGERRLPLPCSHFKRPVRRISSPAVFRSLILPAGQNDRDRVRSQAVRRC